MSKHKSTLFRAADYAHPRYWSMWISIGLLRALLFVLSRKRQRVVDINLKLCFADKTARERRDIKRCCYQNLGISLLEMAMCWWWPESKLKPLVEVRGLHRLEACLNEGKGAILLSGHFTSLEIGARLLALYTPFR